MIRNKFLSFYRLQRTHRQTLLLAWLLLLVVDVALKVMPFLTLQKFLAKHSQQTFRKTDGLPAPYDKLVDIAARNHLYPMTCLRKALVLQFLLNKAGFETALKFGARKNGSVLFAHAWLEWEGGSIGQSPNSQDEYYALSVKKV